MDKNPSLIQAVALKTGLTESTCRDLFSLGYTFIQELNKPDRWEKQF